MVWEERYILSNMDLSEGVMGNDRESNTAGNPGPAISERQIRARGFGRSRVRTYESKVVHKKGLGRGQGRVALAVVTTTVAPGNSVNVNKDRD